MKFKVGDRVIYVSGYHGSSSDNPLWNKFNIVGTITCIADSSDGLPITVKWDNDIINYYTEIDLELYKEKENKITIKNQDITKILQQTVTREQLVQLSVNLENFQDKYQRLTNSNTKARLIIKSNPFRIIFYFENKTKHIFKKDPWMPFNKTINF